MSSVLPKLYGMDGIGTYENYNDYPYRGWAALYGPNRIGQVEYTVGGSISTLKRQIPALLRKTWFTITSAYRIGDGFPTGAKVCLGKFTSQEEIRSRPSDCLLVSSALS